MMYVNQVVINIDSGDTAVYIQGISKELSRHNVNIAITTLKMHTPLELDTNITLNYNRKNKKRE